MLRNLRSRRRPRYGAHICAVFSAILLLFSVSLLYTRLSHSYPHNYFHKNSRPGHNVFNSDSLISDSGEDDISGSEDKIDELDKVEEEQQEEDELRNIDLEEEDEKFDQIKVSGYFFDHVSGVIRKAFNKRSIEEWDDDHVGFIVGPGLEDRSKAAFGSDDVPVDEEVRRKASQVKGIEDALLLKMGRRVSPLREGWGNWFDKKSDFLRKDRMFKSNFEILNPQNNLMLQDPDGVGVTGLTRGDRILQKGMLNEFKKVPFLGKKPLGLSQVTHDSKLKGNDSEVAGNESLSDREKGSEIKRARSRTLNDNEGSENTAVAGSMPDVSNVEYRNLGEKGGNELYQKKVTNASGALSSSTEEDGSETIKNKIVRNVGKLEQLSASEDLDLKIKSRSEYLNHIYADGKRWGYYPGLHPYLTFSGFMDAFLKKGKCNIRVFMVWNSPPWMFSVRHQRGLESLFSRHRDACVVVFSETIELDFFKDNFVNDGYKIAVAMPNLEELLKDTPTHIFSSVWFEWRKTKFYSTHYSELVRLAALYKYGGIYLDSDVIVLKSLSSLDNSVGLEGQLAGSSLNGAVMAFRRHSPFIKECLQEFYLTYDDTNLRYNGADLLTRVARNFLSVENSLVKQLELKLQPSFIFFPISAQNITRYFNAPATESEKAQQDVLFKKILDKSLTFHFWNSLTSALIPEPESLVTKLINYPCIRCLDLL
ncbi:alpha 1,4-glycosyltransferase family protein [Quillaja saponaria]|uniref:Alpha 1,4-glycosyltransferase family protein n=1 Tax=Quillaja saponaria TaxID=32244 RepID=A0AAD7M5A8_QUISA|nr:alpha 1,4-glycosyltransferase family protein [Quillaja saponaria]